MPEKPSSATSGTIKIQITITHQTNNIFISSGSVPQQGLHVLCNLGIDSSLLSPSDTLSPGAVLFPTKRSQETSAGGIAALTGLAIQAYEYTPLGLSLARTIN